MCIRDSCLTWPDSLEANEPLEIYGNGTKQRDLTHVNDVVTNMMLMVEDPRVKSGEMMDVHFGAGKPVSIEAVANAVAGAAGVVTVAFDLYGMNTAAVPITASVKFGTGNNSAYPDLQDLRDKINAYSAETGIVATLSAAKDTVFLNLVRGDREHKNYGITHTIKHNIVNEKEKNLLLKCYKFDCRSCGNLNLKRVVSLGYQPLANNLLNKKDSNCELFPLEVNMCENCFNCQLSIIVNPKKMFTNYLYLSSTSKSFVTVSYTHLTLPTIYSV